MLDLFTLAFFVSSITVNSNARKAGIGWVLVSEGSLEGGLIGALADYDVVGLARPLGLQRHYRPVGGRLAGLNAL